MSWQGVDETVIEKVAIEAGRPPQEPLINADQGDLLLFLFLLAGAVGGFIAGYAFRALFPPQENGTGHTHHLGELFSTRQPHRTGALVRLDVRVKLIVALAAILAVVLSHRVGLPLAVLACCLATMLALGVSLRAAIARLAAPLGIAAAVCLLQALMTGTTPLAAFRLGPCHVTLTREGLLGGLLIGSRVLGAVSVLMVLCLVTPVSGIFAALRWARLPRTWIEIAMLMFRYIGTLWDQAATVVAAQRVRLGYAAWRGSLGSMGSLAGIVALRSIDQAEKTHEAMVARGYQGTLPLPTLPALSKKDLLILCAATLLVGLAYVLAERWPA